MKVKIKKLKHFDSNLPLPTYASAGAAGADIRASLPSSTIEIPPGKRQLIPTGLSMEIPLGFEIQVRPRSGLSLKSDLLVVNSPGTIDSDYRGEIQIIIGNFGKENAVIEHGTRLAQLVLAPVHQAQFELVEELDKTERGVQGFGSTGMN